MAVESDDPVMRRNISSTSAPSTDTASAAAAGEGAGGGSVRGLDGVVAVERSPMLHPRRMAKM
jgi:hypothetical protein